MLTLSSLTPPVRMSAIISPLSSSLRARQPVASGEDHESGHKKGAWGAFRVRKRSGWRVKHGQKGLSASPLCWLALPCFLASNLFYWGWKNEWHWGGWVNCCLGLFSLIASCSSRKQEIFPNKACNWLCVFCLWNFPWLTNWALVPSLLGRAATLAATCQQPALRGCSSCFIEGANGIHADPEETAGVQRPGQNDYMEAHRIEHETSKHIFFLFWKDFQSAVGNKIGREIKI